MSAAERQPLLDEEALHDRQTLCVKPEGNVMSFFMFVPPLVRRKREEDSFKNSLVVFAYFLVILCVVMQSGLIYSVGHEVVDGREAWMNSVVQRRDQFGEAGMDSCGKKEPLCLNVKGVYTCAPKSIQLLGRWKDLDLNDDQIWTRDEAQDSVVRDKMLCRYGVDTLIFYRFLLQEIRSHETLVKFGLVHQNLTKGTGIHLAYYEWFKGDPLLCQYGPTDVCGNVFEAGVFDAPLSHPGVSKLVFDARSAFHYCRELLRPDGRCESMLPSTYRVWRSRIDDQCGERSHEPFVFTNPRDSTDVVSLSHVDYSKQVEYSATESISFKIFLWIILLVFYVNVLSGFRQNIRLLYWVLYFPTLALPGEDGFQVLERDDNTLRGISNAHRQHCAVVVAIHFVVNVLVAVVGTAFLTSDISYMNLLFDALSLAFILQLDELLYMTLVRPKTKEDLENIELAYVDYGSASRNLTPAVRDMLWALLAMFAAAAVLWGDFETTLGPLRHALDCGCLTKGTKCFEANTYDRAWWHEYWSVLVPWSYKAIYGFMDKPM